MQPIRDVRYGSLADIHDIRRVSALTPKADIIDRVSANNNNRVLCIRSEISLAHFGTVLQLGWRPGRDHAPLRQHITLLGDGQRLVHILLDQKYGNAALIDLTDDIEILLHKKRRKTERGLVDQ